VNLWDVSGAGYSWAELSRVLGTYEFFGRMGQFLGYHVKNGLLTF